MLNVISHWKMQIEAKMRHYFHPPGYYDQKDRLIANIKEMWRNWKSHSLLGMKSPWITVVLFLKMSTTELPKDPEIPLLLLYIRELKTYVHTKTCRQMFITDRKSVV